MQSELNYLIWYLKNVSLSGKFLVSLILSRDCRNITVFHEWKGNSINSLNLASLIKYLPTPMDRFVVATVAQRSSINSLTKYQWCMNFKKFQDHVCYLCWRMVVIWCSCFLCSTKYRWYHLVVNQVYYHPQRSWGKVIFSEVCVKNSVHLPEQRMLWDMGNKRVVCILLECILVFMGRYA